MLSSIYEYKTMEEIINDAKYETEEWKKHLNYVVGILTFNLGIGCLGTKHPSKYAWISIIFIGIILVLSIISIFPKTVKKIRKENKTESKKVDQVLFGFLPMIKGYYVYFLGWIFLILIALGMLK